MAAFHRAMHDHPTDRTPGLVYADWLEENGRPAAAGVIRAHLNRGDTAGIFTKPRPVAGGVLNWRRLLRPGEFAGYVGSAVGLQPHERNTIHLYHNSLADPQLRFHWQVNDLSKSEAEKLLTDLHTEGTYVPFDRNKIKLARASSKTLVYVSPDREGKSGDMGKLERLTPGGTSGTGYWREGKERSRVVKVGTGRAAEVADSLRRAFKQQSVLTFTPGRGADRLHVVHTPETDHRKIHEQLLARGVDHQTVLPAKTGSVVHVVDQGGDKTAAVKGWAGATRGRLKTFRGKATFHEG